MWLFLLLTSVRRKSKVFPEAVIGFPRKPVDGGNPDAALQPVVQPLKVPNVAGFVEFAAEVDVVHVFVDGLQPAPGVQVVRGEPCYFVDGLVVQVFGVELDFEQDFGQAFLFSLPVQPVVTPKHLDPALLIEKQVGIDDKQPLQLGFSIEGLKVSFDLLHGIVRHRPPARTRSTNRTDSETDTLSTFHTQRGPTDRRHRSKDSTGG